ncbi:hypothetical protein V6N12_057589 [Hibiscus sabdariffa]|uniref:Uncharacterized protein n=1 Tax=Hibiscus sabdariffa TaxID=183260 RepID=A0ABR2C5W4_9ROSI
MDMKKVSCAIIVAASSMSAVMAAGAAPSPAPSVGDLGPSVAAASDSAPVMGPVAAAAAATLPDQRSSFSSGFLRLLYINSSIKEPPGSILSDKIGLIKFQGIYGVPR